jgi:peptidoglycan/xylan/chitin deacetylase (PgdA/CDA1 family)
MTPRLLVGIDTEGDNQWNLAAREHQLFENIYALPALHTLFEKHGVRPTYVVTWPVASDERSQEVLRFLLLRGDCEIGAHHHAWETPPCMPEDVRRHPYAASLPAAQFDAQLAELTTAITRAVGERPVSYRSGRFGFDASHVSALERFGYLVESSVAPLFYEAHKGGPDFVDAPVAPYFLAYDSAIRAGTSRVLEVPCSAALDRRVPMPIARAYARVPWPYLTKRVLRKLGVMRMNWLRPSYSSLDDMCELARRLVGQGVPVLNMLFHSSEAIVGGSPYNRTQGELDSFRDRLSRFLAYATKELGAMPQTFREFHADYVRPAAAASAAPSDAIEHAGVSARAT